MEIDHEDGSERIRSLSAHTLSAQPSCIDFSKQIPNIFVIGTYQLDESGSEDSSILTDETPEPEQPLQSRSGNLLLFRLEEDSTMFVSYIFHTSIYPIDSFPIPSCPHLSKRNFPSLPYTSSLLCS